MSSKSPTVIFSGYYGMKNIGDDIFCGVTAWGARYYWGIEEAPFLSKTIPITNELSRSLLSEKNYFKGQRVIESVVHILSSDWIVFAGGSIFHNAILPFSSKGLTKLIHRYSNLRIGAIGVSLGPFRSTNDEKANEEFLKQFEFIALRDRRSFEVAQSMHLSCEVIESRDLAFLMPQLANDEVFNNVGNHGDHKPILGASFCRYESFINGDIEQETKRINYLVESIRSLVKKLDITLRLFVFNSHPFYGETELTVKMVNTLESECDVEMIPYTADIVGFYRKISECDAIISTRLHGAILAASARVPLILIEYHKKCTDFLDDIGWPMKYRVGDCELGVNETQEMLSTLLCADQLFVDGLFSEISTVEKLSRKNFIDVTSYFQ